VHHESGRLRCRRAKTRSGWQGVAWQPGLWLAWAVIILAAFAAVAPGLLTHYSPIEGIAGAQRLAPQAGHWLGTDQLGRDVYTRIVYGASHSLSAALAAVTMGLVVGTGLGDRRGVRRTRRVSADALRRRAAVHPVSAALADGDYSARVWHR
jgi:ABC-type dipeptide/oligopeptide/nickel transport system permease subunit